MSVQDDEITSWVIRQEWHDQDHRHPRGRYRAEVRHPLKARRLDEPLDFQLRANRRPLAVRAERPDSAKCAKCGAFVQVSDTEHVRECFSKFVWRAKGRI